MISKYKEFAHNINMFMGKNEHSKTKFVLRSSENRRKDKHEEKTTIY